MPVRHATTWISHPATAHGEGPRVTGRLEMLQVEAKCGGQQQWFICETRSRTSYVDDQAQRISWPDYHRAKLRIPGDWAPVPNEAGTHDHMYQVYGPQDQVPSCMGDGQLFKRLSNLDVFFVLMNQQLVRVLIPLNNFEEDAEQAFEKHERVLNLTLHLACG